MTAKLKPGQTIFDIALEKYGSLEGLEYLIEDNDYEGKLIIGDVDLDDEDIIIRDDSVIDQTIVDYHSSTVLVSY